MELRHLRYFVAVAAEENVSLAAAKLHVSQPGVSRQIHDLEDEIGFPLFKRNGKTVRLTAAGKIFAREVREILRRTAAAVEKARAAVARQSEINVGYVPSGTVEILPRALHLLAASFPAVRVNLHDLSAQEMLPLLLQGKLDIALTLPPRRLPLELAMKELDRYEARVVVGTTHALAKSKSVTLKQLVSEPLAALNRKLYPHHHEHLGKLFATIGHKPRIRSEHDSGTSLLAAVAGGHEFTILPSSISGFAGSRLKLLELRPPLQPWSIVALWRKNSQTEVLRSFVAAALPKPAQK